MPYKRRLKVADIILDFREQILTAHEKQEKDALARLGTLLDHLCIRAYRSRDRKLAGLLEDMVYASSHFIMGVDFRAFDALPSPESISALEVDSSNFDHINARLVRRALTKSDSRPPELGYTPDETGEYVIIDPDWVGIALVNGPYTNTVDFLCYSFDGTLISSFDFDVMEDVFSYAKKKLGVQMIDWEICDIDIQNEDGRVLWQ